MVRKQKKKNDSIVSDNSELHSGVTVPPVLLASAMLILILAIAYIQLPVAKQVQVVPDSTPKPRIEINLELLRTARSVLGAHKLTIADRASAGVVAIAADNIQQGEVYLSVPSSFALCESVVLEAFGEEALEDLDPQAIVCKP